MSVAFTREESAEAAAEVELPDRPISPHPNLVTASGREALTNAMRESRSAYDAAQRLEDAAPRREINRHDGGRGVYFPDPSGHFLEIITRPYGSGAQV